jgi:hypothetical protein
MKIAWLGLLDSDDVAPLPRAQEHLARLARHVVAASRHELSIELISCGGQALHRTLSAGVERIVLPVAGGTTCVWERVSWLLPQKLAGADIVHLHDAFSRACEVAWLVVKPLFKPVCLTDWGVDGPWLSAELSLRELADAVVCHHAAAAKSISGRLVDLAACDVDLRQLGVPAPWPAKNCLDGYCSDAIRATEAQYAAAGQCIHRVYQRLADGRRRAAA